MRFAGDYFDCNYSEIYALVNKLNAESDQNYFINIKEKIIDNSFGFIYHSPSVNFLRVIDEKSVCEAIKKYIQIKHILLDNSDIIKKAEESESGTPLADLWNDLRVKIWDWKYSAAFIFINDDKYVEELKNTFSECLLFNEKITVINKECGDRYNRKWKDIYDKCYELTIREIGVTPLDGDVCSAVLSSSEATVINGKCLFN